ncbi:hypothetical protein [Mobilicoccus caccae]|uniref:Uncharacterized protein n=1 Tax=Mobilicoccus caccae TaxID=1859295 RepID=A0ABQ6IRI7_9MICO|nr:hypothetical protein [Mobilicoccus caccae]GMA39288.1 hypothetical protein GCM10025883_13330 [Mobilicoccus caccae]GMA39413.1 hypothetical protein GCM10025883_14580 [Mobilicoccus caccae]
MRSDIGLDLLIDGQITPEGRPLFGGELPPAHVTVVVSAASLLGVNDAPGTVDLRGREEHLPAFAVRDLALSRGSVWRRLVTDPTTGMMTELSTERYEITGDLRERILARDRHSRVPGSMRPASRCDTDHEGVSDGLCKRGVSHLKEIDYGYDQAEEERRARAGA